MRTLMVSDSLAFSLLSVRPEGMWDIDWADQRNKNLNSPEYGLMYLGAWLKGCGVPFDVLNIMGDAGLGADFFLDLSDRALYEKDAEDDVNAWCGERWEAVLAEIEARDPDVIMWPMSYYFMVRYVRKLLADVRRRVPRATIVTGGNYATMHAEEVAREGLVDYVVQGEGEHTARELLGALAGEMPVEDVAGLLYVDADGALRRTAVRERENDLDRFPHLYTAWEEFRIRERHDVLCELIPHGDYWPGTGMASGRGCPERCSFCLDPAIWNRKVKFHSPEYIADAVRFCQEHFPSPHGRFFFGDSTFTLRWKRLDPLLAHLADIGMSYTCQTRADALDDRRLEKMAEAGFATVGIGAESLNNEILNEIALKREDPEEIVGAALMSRSHGIQPVLTLICGFPSDTRESLVDTCDELRANDLHVSSFFPLVVFRGIPLFEGFAGVQGFTGSRFWERREEARLNEWSEEWLRLSEEFPTKEALVGFATHLNQRVRMPVEETVPVPA